MTRTTQYVIGGVIAAAAIYFLFFYGKTVKLKYNFVADFNKQGQVPDSGDEKMANFRIPNWANADYNITKEKVANMVRGRTMVVKNADGKKVDSYKVRKVFKDSQGGDVFVQLDVPYSEVTPKAKVNEDQLGTLIAQ